MSENKSLEEVGDYLQSLLDDPVESAKLSESVEKAIKDYGSASIKIVRTEDGKLTYIVVVNSH